MDDATEALKEFAKNSVRYDYLLHSYYRYSRRSRADAGRGCLDVCAPKLLVLTFHRNSLSQISEAM